ILLLLVNLLWAGQFPAYKAVSEHMGVISLNFWTFAVAIVLLSPFLAVSRRRASARVRLKAKELAQFVLLGTLGIIPPSVCLAWGISQSTASAAAIISLVIPVLTALMAVVMLSERMTHLRWLSFGIAIAGTVLISKIGWNGDFLRGSLLVANMVIFLSWIGSAFYNTYSKKLLGSFTELEVLIYGYVVACASCMFLAFVTGEHPFSHLSTYSFSTWGGILILGGLSWGLAMVLWMWVLKRLDVSQISVSIYLLPLFGVILSAFTLHEHLTTLQIGGGITILVATFLTSEYESRRNSVTREI
ncbi:MAG: DMT family transporter, partial [Ktedonobacteraceae bacterium]